MTLKYRIMGEGRLGSGVAGTDSMNFQWATSGWYSSNRRISINRYEAIE